MKVVEKPVTITEDDTFKSVLSKYGCLGFDKQENLGELIKEMEGNLDLEKGILSFSDDIVFDIQILGYYSEDLHQWSWAWDNENVGFDEKLIEAACKMKEFGHKYQLDEFVIPVFETDYDYCHTWALISSAILNMDAYYSHYVDGLNIFVLIKSDLIKENNTPLKFRDTYVVFQDKFNVYHNMTFESYTKLKGYGFKGETDFMVAKIGEARVIAGFTERGNLTHIQFLEP